MADTSEKQKLLIVEDDLDLQAQLEWAFTEYDVVVAGDRAAALTAQRTENPAVITLDLGLPPDPDGTSEGFATLRELVAQNPAVKVIVASGHEARESAQKAIALGAYDFYSKPINITDLSLIVGRAFHLAQIERRIAGLPSRRTSSRARRGSSPARRRCSPSCARSRRSPTSMPR